MLDPNPNPSTPKPQPLAPAPPNHRPGLPHPSHIARMILLVAPLFLNLGVSALWDSTEAFYGETAREMLERSDFVYPTFNYEPRNQKPPLTYWCIAASYRIFGIDEFSTRVPSALAVCFLFGFLIWFLEFSMRAGGEAFLDGPESGLRPPPWTFGLLAASILATTPRFLVVARRLPIDCLLTVFLSVSLLLLYRAFRETAAEANRAPLPFRWKSLVRVHWKWALAGVFLGLAFLTKGPGGPLLAVVICGLFAWMEKLRPSRAKLFSFCAAFAATSVPYYWILFNRGGGAILYAFLMEENLGRYTSLDFGQLRGGLYYLQVLLVDAFPWSWFLPASVWLWKSWRTAHPPLLRFCWIWFLVVVGFFSFSRNKQEYYLLPAYVALAILLAHFFAALQRSRTARARLLRATGILLAPALVSVGAILLWLTRFLPIDLGAWILTALLAFGAVATVRLLWRGRPQRAVEFLALLLLGVALGVCALLLPILETVRPTRSLTAQIARLWQPGDRAGYFRFTSPSMSFYLRTQIFELYDVDPLQAELDRPGYSFLLVRADEYDRLPPGIRDRLEIIDSAPYFQTRGKEILRIRSLPRLPRVLLVRERNG